LKQTVAKEAPTLSEADQQNLVSLYYVHIRAPPPEEWNGEGGTVSKIVRALSYGKEQRRRVKEVIANYYFTILIGGEYNPQRKSRTNATAIKDRSHVQQMVCNCIKSGVSLMAAQILVNTWCIKHGERTVTHSAVVLCVKKDEKESFTDKENAHKATLTQKAIEHVASFALLHRCFFALVKILVNTSIFLTNFLTR
jgi:hypothetical protein